jgi:aspartate/methionine/tyrosine aminotransferase
MPFRILKCSLKRQLPFLNFRRSKIRVHRCWSTSSSTTTTTTSRPLRPFQIEQYDGWLASIGLSDSDVEPLKISQLLALADEECLQLWDELSLGYPLHVQGDPRLRTEIATRLYPKLLLEHDHDHDHGSSSSSSIARSINCMAPQEGIFCAMQALLKPGDHVVVTGPTYQSLSEIPRSIGCHVTHWLPTISSSKTEDNGSSTTSTFRFDPEKLRELLIRGGGDSSSSSSYSTGRRSTKLVVVNFPHNPTGALPTPSEWEEIIQICREHRQHDDDDDGGGGAYLFCDEMYRGLEHEGVESLPPVVEAYERGISLSGLSKSFGLAGLRMGWIVSRDEDFMKRVQQINDYTSICTSSPSEVLSLIALRNATTLIERCRRIVGTVREDVKSFCLQNSDVLDWAEPRAGSFVFPKLLLQNNQPGGGGGGGGARKYCDELLEKSDIMLLPSSLFEYGEQRPVDDSRVRISLGRESIPQHLEKWKEHGF